MFFFFSARNYFSIAAIIYHRMAAAAAASSSVVVSSKDIPLSMHPPPAGEAADRVDWMCRVYRALERVTVPLTQSRQNVRTRPDAPIRGMCLGCVHARGQGPVQSASTRAYPSLTRLLVRFAKRCVPGIAFTSIQVNKNYMSALHVDKGNAGPSHIVGLGQYEGGGLWVWPRDSEEGAALDVRHTWQRFDGTRPHCTLPYAGTRYTLIFFTQGAHAALPAEDRAQLTALGFPPPAAGAAPTHPSAGPAALLEDASGVFVRWRERNRELCQHAPLGLGADRDTEVGVIARPPAGPTKRKARGAPGAPRPAKRLRVSNNGDPRCPQCPYDRMRERKDASGRLKSHCWRCLVERRARRRAAAEAAAAEEQQEDPI